MRLETRRSFLSRSALAVAVGVAGCVGDGEPTTDGEGSTPTAETSAPTTRGPSGETPRRVTPDREGVAWRVDLGAAVGAAPAVAGDRVYVGGWRETYGTPTPARGDAPPGASDHLFALDLADGSVAWDYVAGPVQRQPRVVGDTVYVVRGYDGLHGHGYQVRGVGTDGHELWTHEAPSLKFLTVLGADASGMAVGTHDDYLSGGEERVTELTPGGDVRWQRAFDDAYAGALDAERAYVSAYTDRVRAFDRATGETRWTVETTELRPPAPVVVGETVLVGAMDLQGADRTSGDRRWVREGLDLSGVAAADGTAFAATGEGTVLALDPADGSTVWTRSAGTNWAWIAVAGGRLYAGWQDGALVARDTDTGERLWRETFDGVARPVPAGERVYAHRPDAARTVALAADDGTRQRTYRFGARPTAVVPGDGVDVVATRSGSVYGLAR